MWDGVLLVYQNYYRFRREPFGPTPDPEFLYKSEVHQQALEQLLRGVRQREGMVLLTGDIGTGKTTTTRALLQLLEGDVFTALVRNPFVGAVDLLRALLLDFQVVSDGSALREAERQHLVETLSRFLLSLDSIGASALVVVDEAQNLSPSVLEQLRVLTTLESDQHKLLQILLVGQPELLTLLGTSEMRALNQRIARRCRLRPLTREEGEQYVGFRIRLARETSESLFSDRAMDLIHECSQGIPRRINQLCDRALEEGYLALSPMVDESLVREAATALDLPLERDSASAAKPRSVQKSKPTQRRKRGFLWTGLVVALGLALPATIAALGILKLGVLGVPDTPQLPSSAVPSFRAPVEFSAGAGGESIVSYCIRTGLHETRPAANVTAALLRYGGVAAEVAPAGNSRQGYVVWIGPYESLVEARSIETTVTRGFGVADAQIVAEVLSTS